MPYMNPTTGLTRRVLEQRGFRGFVRFDELATRGAPGEAGVYAVVRPAKAYPAFAPRSTAGHHKRRGDPSVTVDELLAAWVDGASVVYIGKASAGKDGRRGLRKRLDEYRRHGAGGAAAHWGGRYIWQLEDAPALLVAWLPTPGQDPGDVEAGLIAEFVAFHGARPFANRNKGRRPGASRREQTQAHAPDTGTPESG